MALTFTQRPVDEDGNFVAVPGSLRQTITSVTVGASGDYSSGGIPLTPQQLGLSTAVVYGVASLRTTAASGTAVDAVIDATNPAAPKLKLNAVAAECVGAGVVALVADVLAYGY